MHGVMLSIFQEEKSLKGIDIMSADSGKIRKLCDSCRIVCVSQTNEDDTAMYSRDDTSSFAKIPESPCLWKSISHLYTNMNRHDKLGCVHKVSEDLYIS